MINPEEFKALAEAIQALAVTAAVVIGGVWSVFTFRTLQTRRKAQLELDESERRIRGMSVVNIDLEIEPLPATTPDKHLLRVCAKIENRGSRNTVISFDSYPLILEELIVDDIFPLIVYTYLCDHLVHQHSIDEDTGDWAPGVTDVCTLRAGMSSTLEFLVGVRRSGIYRAEFAATVSSEERRVAEESGMRLAPDTRMVWNTERIFNVGELPQHTERDKNVFDHNTLIRSLTIYAAGISKRLNDVEAEQDLGEGIASLSSALEAILDLRSALLYSKNIKPDDLRPLVVAVKHYATDPLVNSLVVLDFLGADLRVLGIEEESTA